MSSLFVALFALVASSFRTRAALQAEIVVLVRPDTVITGTAELSRGIGRGNQGGVRADRT